jgi:hypothetical protein
MKVLLTTLVSLVAASALLVPVAAAGSRPDDRSGVRGPGAQLWLDPSIASVVTGQSDEVWLEPSIANAVAQASHPALWLDPAIADAVRSAASVSVRPDDRAGRRESPLLQVAAEPAPATRSFDWSDAGIGAGAVAGIFGLIVTGLLVVRNGRRELGHA